MIDPQNSRRIRPFALLGAGLAGFFLADMVAITWRAPGLLHPSHLAGLGALALSGLVLYAAVGVYFLGFHLMLRILTRLVRLRLDWAMTAVITVFLAPLFLVVQARLQWKLLGGRMIMKSPFFYVPTAISLGFVLVILFLIHLGLRSRAKSTFRLARLFEWHSLIGITFVISILYGLPAIPGINVTGVFTGQEERMAEVEHAPRFTQDGAADGPNFVVLKIEAFREDEFTPENAPFLWNLAHQNIWFTRYHTVSSGTRASLTSFFASLYPAQHECYYQGVGGVMAQAIETLPLLLQDRGYRTLMVTTNPATMDRVFGFEEVYYRFNAIEPYKFRVLSLEPFLSFRFLKRYLAGFRISKIVLMPPDHSWVYFEAPRVNATIERQLAKKATGEDARPFFLYVHYMEPHAPYYQHPHRAVQFNIYSPDRREGLLSAYRAEIRAVDQAIADLCAFLTHRSLLDNTYLFVSADHGEEFYDHGDWGHGKSLYPEVVSVPAILVLPRGQGSPRLVETLVENIDVLPTFADLAGVPAPDYWEGRSFASLIGPRAEVGVGTAAVADRPDIAFSQCRDEEGSYWASAIAGDWQIIFKEPKETSLSSPDRRKQRRKTMLFNLADDPLALRDLHGQGKPNEEQLATLLDLALQRLEATAHLFRCEKREIDPELLEQLKALGYVR